MDSKRFLCIAAVAALGLGAVMAEEPARKENEATEEEVLLQRAAELIVEEECLEEEEEEEVIAEEVEASIKATQIEIIEIVDEMPEEEIREVEASGNQGSLDVEAVRNAVKVVTVAPDNAVKPAANESERIYEAVEQKAEFPGGQPALAKWIAEHLRYPAVAQENGIQGRVIVKFVVEKDGTITRPVVVKGVDKDLDREAVRLVKSMPKWKPGKNNGEIVRTYYYLPVTFKLQN